MYKWLKIRKLNSYQIRAFFLRIGSSSLFHQKCTWDSIKLDTERGFSYLLNVACNEFLYRNLYFVELNFLLRNHWYLHQQHLVHYWTSFATTSIAVLCRTNFTFFSNPWSIQWINQSLNQSINILNLFVKNL